jgi:hypothetical protein
MLVKSGSGDVVIHSWYNAWAKPNFSIVTFYPARTFVCKKNYLSASSACPNHHLETFL